VSFSLKKYYLSYIRNFSGLPTASWMIQIAIFANSMGNVTTVFLSLYLVNQLGFSVFQTGVLMAGFGVGSMVGSYLSGLLCYKFSPYHISFMAILINGITLLMLCWPTQFYPLLSLIFFVGGSNAAFAPANRITLMQICLKVDRSRVSSLRYMAINLGMGTGIFIGGLLATWGFYWIFIFTGISTLIAAFILAIYCKPVAPINKASEIISSPKNNSVFADKNALIIFSVLLLTTLVFAQLKNTYPIYLHTHYHLSERLFSYVFLLNTLLIVVFQVPLLNSLKNSNAVLLTGIGGFLIGAGFYLLPVSTTYAFALFSCTIWTIGEMLFFSTIQVLIYESASEKQKGKYMGIYQMIQSFSNMLGPLAGGYLYAFNNGKFLWQLCGLLGICTLLIHFYMYNKKK
jgi:predicted MFS family arabinose efflux permease